MGLSSFSHLLILLVVVLLIFGPGRLSKVMGEFGKGIRSLRDGMGGEASDEAKLRKLMMSEKVSSEEVLRLSEEIEKKKSSSES